MVSKIVTIRHGIRLDFEDDNWRDGAGRPNDTPLSETGVIQARETAVFLHKRFDISALFSSPFFRALETANIIAEKLKLKIKVEDGFSEWMNRAWFENRPEILDPEERNNEFEHIDQDYHSYRYPLFPEYREHDEVFNRVRFVLYKLIHQYKGTIGIVGHGATMHAIGRVMLDTKRTMDHGMCAVNCIEREGEKWMLTMATREHLSNKGEEFMGRVQ